MSVLSGGEKSRLALARMLLKQSNFLILDEPTNHLDMNSKKVLMNALKQYGGTILLISHDREFLDGITNRIIEVKDNNIKNYAGNCSYYLMKKNEEVSEAETTKVSKTQAESKTKKTKEQKRTEAENRNKLYRMTNPLRKNIEKIEREIKIKENRLKEIEKEMLSEEFYKDSGNIKNTNKEFNDLKKQIQNLYDDWLENSNKIKEIESISISN